MTHALTKKAGSRALARVAFDDHPRFHGTVGRAVLGGGIGAFVAHAIGSVIGLGTLIPLLITLAAAGALAAIGAERPGLFHTAAGAVLGLTGGILHSVYAAEWPWFGALMLGAAAAPILAGRTSAARMAVTAVFAGAMAYGGAYVAGVLQSSGVLAGAMPGALGSAVAGCAAGLFLGLGAAPRHLVRAEDAVESAYNDALKRHGGELYDLLERTLHIYQAVRKDLADSPAPARLGEQVSEMSLRILGIADKCRRIEQELGAAPVVELEARIKELADRSSSAKDETARATLSSALESMLSQQRSVEQIERGRERVVARLHANVALLEKVRFSLVQMHSADAERVGLGEGALGQTLEELGRELDATSSAVGEVYGEDPIAALEAEERRAEISASAPTT